VTNNITEILDYLLIKSKPVYSYGDCMAVRRSRYSQTINDDNKDDDDYHEDENLNHNKESSGVPENVVERFRIAVYLCDEDELDFLRDVADFSERKEPCYDYPKLSPARVLIFSNYVFVFLYEDNLHFVLPSELIEVYRAVVSEENFTQINARNRNLHIYANGLCALYGAYEITHFVDVWNRHHKDKITFKEAETFLFDRIEFQSHYYISDNFVIHDCLFEDDFDQLFETVHDVEYYMPTKSVVREYANRDYGDFEIDGSKEVEDFVTEFISDEHILEDLLYDLIHSYEQIISPEAICAILKNAGLPITDTAFCEKFERLYNAFRNNVRVWELRGFTIYQYQTATGIRIPQFGFPKKQKA